MEERQRREKEREIMECVKELLGLKFPTLKKRNFLSANSMSHLPSMPFRFPRIPGAALTTAPALCALLFLFPSCIIVNDLLTPQPVVTGRAFDLIDTARHRAVEPTGEFVTRPESLALYPSDGRSYTFTCSEYGATGTEDGRYYNFELQKSRPDIVSYRIQYAKSGREYGYRGSDSAIPGKLDDHDSLLMRPLCDGAYFTAFKDIDSSRIVLYQTAYQYNQGLKPYCCQVFKEGLGLLYEHYHNGISGNVYSKAAILAKVNDSPVDVVPVLSRIAGMQSKFAADILKDSIVLRVERSLYDSIVGKKYWNDPPLISVKSDTLWSFAPFSVYAFYLYKPDTIVTLNCGAVFDSVQVSGFSYSLTGRIPYEFGW